MKPDYTEEASRVEELLEQLRRQEEIIAGQQARIGQLEEDLARNCRALDTMYRSLFWRITKPPRLFLDLIKTRVFPFFVSLPALFRRLLLDPIKTRVVSFFVFFSELFRWLFLCREEKHRLRRSLLSLSLYGFSGAKRLLRRRMHPDGEELSVYAPFTAEDLSAQRHLAPQPLRFSLVVPLYNTPTPFLREMLDSVLRQTYEGWELCLADGSDGEHPEVGRLCRKCARWDRRIRYLRLEHNGGISANSNAALELARGEYVGLLDHDDLLHPAALYEVARTIGETGADFVYTDESVFHLTPADAFHMHFKPDFAPDTLCSNNYICHFTVFKRSLLAETGLFDPACDGSQDHDLFLRLTEKARRIAHIPEILYFWRSHPDSVAGNPGVKPYTIAAGVLSVEKRLKRLGLEGTVTPVRPGLTIYRVRYALRGEPKVSILIPNYEHLDELKTCLQSLFAKTSYPNYEIVIVENNSRSPELFAYYDELRRERENVKIVTRSGFAFNYSALNNFGASFCTGDYLLLLNNDMEIVSPDWLQEMLMFAQRRDVGVVGAKLLYPDGSVQHAGVGLGLSGLVAHLFYQAPPDGIGYSGRLLYAQDLTAVTGACLLLRRDVWEEVGGLDETFAVAYNDIDLCMRIRKAGYLVVWTPFAELIHYESKSRGGLDSPEKIAFDRMEAELFRQRWEKELADGDPYLNPNFQVFSTNLDVDPEQRKRKHSAR